MTKSTITREQLLEIIETDHVQCGEASYLARMALAAMDSEPVAWIAQNKNTGEVEIDEPFAKATNPKYWTDAFPVYRHAQQPVVPEGYKLVPTELTSEMVKAFRSFCEAYDDDLIAGYKAILEASPQPVPVVPYELKEAAADFLTVLDEYPERLVPINRDSAVVRALRAAMLGGGKS